MGVTALFFYGTLCDTALLAAVLGRGDAVCRPARLGNHAVFAVKDEPFPILVAQPGAVATGVLCDGLGATDIDRLHFYEAGFAYFTREVCVQTNTGPVMAKVYFPTEGAWTPGGPWDLMAWQAKFGPALRRAAVDVMASYAPGAPPVTPHRQLVLGQRAQARVAAAVDPTPSLPGTPDTRFVEIHEKTVPYDVFFNVEDYRLTVPRFDNAPSAPMVRSVFVSGDAVSVLPYDPRTDRVLLVEQFRLAALSREDAGPWLLEPVAGRVDEGESYPEAAHRELTEETGTTAQSLVEIGRYYSSPGTLMEFMVSYVALTDLPEPGTWLGGLASESEDIRSHVIAYDTLLDWQAKGHLRNGPLLISVYWLAANRDRLRAEAGAAPL